MSGVLGASPYLRYAGGLALRLALASAITFLLIKLVPGDPAVTLAGENATLERVTKIRGELGLDRPIVVQFLAWLGDAVRGDLGRSMISGDPVLGLVLDRCPVTLALAFLSLALATAGGVVLGVVAATSRGTWLDRLIAALSSLGVAVPPFWLGLMLVVAFAIETSVFPSYGYVRPSEGLVDWLHHLALPAATLAVSAVAEIARQTRGAMIDVLERDYVRTARAKGLPRLVVLLKHAAKNAAIPVVTVIGLQASLFLAGSVVVETIFGLPGLGSLVFNSVTQRDIPVIQGVVLASAVLVLAVNMLVDLTYRFFDPRLRAP